MVSRELLAPVLETGADYKLNAVFDELLVSPTTMNGP